MGPDRPGSPAGGGVAGRLRRLFDANGPLRFDTFMETVLYGEGGFYSTTPGRAGRRGDFVTSVELGSAFAETVAAAVAGWARPHASDVVRVVDAGGGRGTLALGLVDAWQRIPDAPSLEVAVVDVSGAARSAADEAGLSTAASLDDLPWRPDVVVANELLDNLPSRLLYGADAELRVGFEDDSIALFHTPLTKRLAAFRDRWLPDTAVDSVVPVPSGALAWVDTVHAVAADASLVLVFDYGDDAAGLARRSEWAVRAYRGHEQVDPLDAPGTADVTCDVPFDVVADALVAQGWDVNVSSQAEWLGRHGIDEMAAGARAAELAAAQDGDTMARLRARTCLGEIGALVDLDGLGGFRVIEAHRTGT